MTTTPEASASGAAASQATAGASAAAETAPAATTDSTTGPTTVATAPMADDVPDHRGDGVTLVGAHPTRARAVPVPDDRDDTARLSPSALLVAPALAVAGYGLAKAAAAGVSTADVIRVELTLGWVVAALCLLVRPALRPLGRLVSLASLLGAVVFTAAELGETTAGSTGHAARFVATLVPALLMAVGVHFLLSVPDGRLVSRTRGVVVAAGYAAGAAFGLWAWFGPGRLTDPAAVVGWLAAVAVGLVGAARRYRLAPGIDRQRLQWIAAGAVASVEFGLVVVGLYVLVRWPIHPWAIAAGGTLLVPAGVAAASFRRLLGSSDRVLVWLLTVTGLSAVVLAIYVLVILGFGHEPGPGDRQVLGLSILAAAVVALGASVSHQRVQRYAQRLVYGTDDVPDDVVKTFSTRLTRAVAMDELLLQLTESLHKSMVLTSAEVFTGYQRGPRAQRVDPGQGPGTLHIGPQEQPVVARAGVSGNAWTAGVAAGGDRRTATSPSSGCARSPTAGSCWAWWWSSGRTPSRPSPKRRTSSSPNCRRQVGLALHNVRLDSALQSTLDEVRRQAAELRASRSRIVAPLTPSGGGSNGTSTTAPSNTWWRWP